MLSKVSKALLVLSSYAPLFLILTAYTYDEKVFGVRHIYMLAVSNIAIAFFLLSLLGIMSLIFTLNSVKKLNPSSIKIQQVLKRKDASLSYLITYLVPFITFDFESYPKIIGAAMLLVLIGFLYLKSNMIYINPLLEIVFGYKIYKIIVFDDQEKILLSKSSIITDKTIAIHTLSKGVYIDAKA